MESYLLQSVGFKKMGTAAEIQRQRATRPRIHEHLVVSVPRQYMAIALANRVMLILRRPAFDAFPW